MAQVTVSQFAEVLKVPVEKLLAQFEEAGIQVGGADAVGGEDHRLLRARRPHQLQHARHRAPAHVHAEFHFGNAEMRGLSAEAEIERDGERRAAADAMVLDGADRHLLHLVPGAAHARADHQRRAAGAHAELRALAAFGILQVEARRKAVRRAGEDDDGGGGIVLEGLRRGAQLAHGGGRQRVQPVAAVETHDGDAAFRAEPLLDGDVLHRLCNLFRTSGVSRPSAGSMPSDNWKLWIAVRVPRPILPSVAPE